MRYGQSVRADLVERIELPTGYPIGPVNVYVIRGQRLTLVDTGSDLEEGWAV